MNREEKEKELARLNELQLEERVLRLRKALQNRVSGFRTLGRYAHTTSGPTVYWHAAQDNERSEECVKRSAEEMEKRCEEETERIESEIRVLQEQYKQREEKREEKKMERMEEEKVEAILILRGKVTMK